MGLEMNGDGEEEQTAFEIAVVVPRRVGKQGDESYDCVEFLVDVFRKAGLIVDRVIGFQEEFIKVQSLSYYVLCSLVVLLFAIISCVAIEECDQLSSMSK
ncbi:Anoctamin-like protein [Camellia lanceoleosa]|uniref:Anoctamin-like protein n=1 Tax=Camellia lanceoleosa TaxID=1840588 RepID=A0ACC0IQK8_9ERIC|nr:Anoctamin-like protein [Camellia lanceoleosa]